MKNQNPLNLTRTNMTIAWLSIFAEAWLLLLGKLPIDGIRMLFFCFFILVAAGSWLGTVVEERQHQSSSKGEIKK